jgi:hypothetical protein
MSGRLDDGVAGKRLPIPVERMPELFRRHKNSKKTRMKSKTSHQSNENLALQSQFPFV